MRLVQLIHQSGTRRLAEVSDDRLHFLRAPTLYDALTASPLFAADPSAEPLDYTPVYLNQSAWRLLPPIDHPEPSRCLVSGTGLTHTQSAANRDAMHAAAQTVTDSARMYQLGVAGGKPAPGEIGAAPEWFYKGTGLTLRGAGDPLEVPPYAEDGGEEPEIAGVYFIDATGTPRRIGMAQGNEFSDHVFEKRNYLNLAGSKLRTCSIGPEIVTDFAFHRVQGRVTVERAGHTLWTAPIVTGEDAMCHSLANIEHHHFKFEAHRRPGDIHVHFYGAGAFSFGAGVALQDGDITEVSFASFGRPLRNPVRIDPSAARIVTVQPL